MRFLVVHSRWAEALLACFVARLGLAVAAFAAAVVDTVAVAAAAAGSTVAAAACSLLGKCSSRLVLGWDLEGHFRVVVAVVGAAAAATMVIPYMGQ